MNAELRTTTFNHEIGGPIITDLPEPILIDILSSLPVKTIINCRCVCKTWLNLLLNPHFAKIHFSKSPTQILGMKPVFNGSRVIAKLDEGLKSMMSIARTKPYWDYCLPNVANGFICLPKGWKPCHIHNPITGQHIVVQQDQIERKNCYTPIEFGLGFSRKSNELKLLRLVVPSDGSLLSNWHRREADIYRLSTNSWTSSIGEPPFRMFNLYGPFVNGVVHSKTTNIDKTDGSIFAFDFEDEKFCTVPAPPIKGEDYVSVGTLELLEGCLCISYRKSCQHVLDIWVMTEYGAKDSWTKRYVIKNVIGATRFAVYRLMKNGEILVVCDDQHLISYDPKGKSSRYIKFQEGYEYSTYFIVPFVPNFTKVQTNDQVEGTKC